MEKSIGRLVSILYRKNQIYLNSALKPYNITAAELIILLYLFKHSNVSQEELSAFIMIDKAATARGVQSLIKKGYVNRTRDLKDRRAYQVSVTEKAESIKNEIYEKLDAWTRYLTKDIDAEAIEIMFEVLEKMIEKVEDIDSNEIGRKA